MSRDLGRDVPDLEKLYARKLWADFSYPSELFFFPGLISCPTVHDLAWHFLILSGSPPFVCLDTPDFLPHIAPNST